MWTAAAAKYRATAQSALLRMFQLNSQQPSSRLAPFTQNEVIPKLRFDDITHLAYLQ
jgi:hypothetical protein